MNGFLIINKDKETTSYDVVHQVKKKLNMKRVGHTGTLDPDTTGLLVVALGRATKFIPVMSENKIKEYQAEITFGVHTDTYDISGQVLKEDDTIVSYDEFTAACKKFIGKYNQYPPIYSAKKINGKRLYDHARNGTADELEIKPQEIEINAITEIKGIATNKFSFKVRCSKGTYIRSLIVDIAKELNTVATMSGLERTKTEGFDMKNAKKLEEITTDDVIDLNQYILAKYPSYEVYGKIANLIKNGAKLRYRDSLEFPCAYVDQQTKEVIALYDRCDKENIKPVVMI